MPLFIDIHVIDGSVRAKDVAAVHARDLAVQDRYGVCYRRYWVAEASGRIFCLVEAPSAEAAVAVHRDAHGLIADEIHEIIECT